MEYLNYFGKSREDKIIVFDTFTFNNLFVLLLNDGFIHENALNFVLSECDLNAYVFQECIFNKAYLNLTPRAINYREAGRRSILHQIALSYLT